jgi:hypothetical protein
MYGNVPLPGLDALPHGQPSHYLGILAADFKELLNRVAGMFATRKALADALDMDPSRLSRAINAGDFPFNIENCLRLAQVSGEPASDVLRAADKGAIAELIESLYGQQTLASNERELLQDWKAIPAPKRENLRRVLRDAAAPIPHTDARQSPAPHTAAAESGTDRDGRGLAPQGLPGQADPVPHARSKGGRLRALARRTVAADQQGSAVAAASRSRASREPAPATHPSAAGHRVRPRKPRR